MRIGLVRRRGWKRIAASLAGCVRGLTSGGFLCIVGVLTALIASSAPAQELSFELRYTLPVEYSPTSIALANLRGRAADLVIADSQVAIYQNGGPAIGGTFWIRSNNVDWTSYTHQVRPTSVATGDFNRDGTEDIAVTNILSGSVTVVLTNGGTSGIWTVAVGGSPWQVLTGDFNRDGKLDLAVVNGSYLSVLLGTGTGTFELQTEQPPVGIGEESGLAIGDFNADGILDLAVTNPGLDTVSLLVGRGDGTFNRLMDVPAGSKPGAIVAGDFNDDGKVDLAFINMGNSKVSVMLGDGVGGFGPRTEFSSRRFGSPVTQSGPNSLAIGDFNGDGKRDLAVVNPESSAINGSVAILLGDGGGGFTRAAAVPVGLYPISIAVADFDFDGKQDFAVLNAFDNTVSVLYNTTSFAPAGVFAPALNIAAEHRAYRPVVADVNNDGKPDLVALAVSSEVSIRLNSGNGVFGTESRYSIDPPGVAHAAVGDFNRDGKIDLAVASGSSADSATISILLGTGTGTFVRGTQLDTRGYLFQLAVGDFNRDGKLDVVATNAIPGTVSVYLGNGDGSFRTASVFNAGRFPERLAAGDFNHDGKLDLIVGNDLGPDTSILFGNGDGTFGAPSVIANRFDHFVSGDFNGDGRLDFALPIINGFTVYLGQGDGTFELRPTADTRPEYPWEAVLGDFNRDGNRDLAFIARQAPQDIMALSLGDGGSHNDLKLGRTIKVPEGSSDIAVADLNGDGRLDLITTCCSTAEGLASISVWLNTTPNTSPGTAVTVRPTDSRTGTAPVTIAFSVITETGVTSVTTSTSGPTPPAGFSLGTPPLYYELATTAGFTGPMTVCIDYTGITFAGAPQLLHFENGAWNDVTTSVDAANRIVCGTVSSLSPFALVQARSEPGRMSADGHIDLDGRRFDFKFRVSERVSGDEFGWLDYRVHELHQRPIEHHSKFGVAAPRHHRLDRFRSTHLASVVFSDNPASSPGRRPRSGMDAVVFTGIGLWNDKPGYTFEVRAVDAGEPGRHRDTFDITIRDPAGHIVSTVKAALTAGNIQSLRARR